MTTKQATTDITPSPKNQPIPIAYLITFHTYGTWLHGEEDGSVDRNHNEFNTPVLLSNSARSKYDYKMMVQPEYSMDSPRRAIVLATIQEVCSHRGWSLLAAHVRTNHVHVVAHASHTPKKVMDDIKAYASRYLNDSGFDGSDRRRWTRHGSTRYLWTPETVEAAIRYVVSEQGEPMDVFENEDRHILY